MPRMSPPSGGANQRPESCVLPLLSVLVARFVCLPERSRTRPAKFSNGAANSGALAVWHLRTRPLHRSWTPTAPPFHGVCDGAHYITELYLWRPVCAPPCVFVCKTLASTWLPLCALRPPDKCVPVCRLRWPGCASIRYVCTKTSQALTFVHH